MPSEVSTVGGNQSVEEMRRELAEAREQQAATAEILAAISNAPSDPSCVFAQIAASAARLCDAYDAGILQVAGNHWRIVAHHGPIPITAQGALTRGLPTGRTVLDRQTLHVADLQAETDEYPEGSEFARRLGYRTILCIPLLRTDEAIGVIFVRRPVVRPFTNRQIELLKAFADQAVIAIENTRLFEAEQTRTRELHESLEYQTAISNVLNVISRSPNQLQPVLDEIASTAANLCGASNSVISLEQAGELHLVAAHGLTTKLEKGPIDRGWESGRAYIDRKPVHVHDMMAARDEFPLGYEIGQRRGHRTTLGIPLLREGKAIGCLFLRRTVVEPFSEKQIALVQTFADQAVIAIENARLFGEVQARTKELQESLEYQTATSDVLGVISRSPTQLQPVVDAIVQTAKRLCEAEMASMWHLRDGKFYLLAHTLKNTEIAAYLEQNPIPTGANSFAGRAVLERRVVHVPDVRAHREIGTQSQLQRTRVRTMLVVPILREGEPIGVLSLSRTEVPRPFSDKQIELVTTFASQAVIAINNVGLFEEVQARNRELTETGDILSVISSSPTDVQPIFNAIVRSAVRLCDGLYSFVIRFDGELMHIGANHNYSPEALQEVAQVYPTRPSREQLSGRVILNQAVVHIDDVLDDPEYWPKHLARAGGWRAMLGVPMLHEGKPIGMIGVVRGQPGRFSEMQVKLLRTFADQAVIAIENTRLFEAEQASKRELQESLEYQTATSEVLNVISRSPTELQPVLDAIAATAARLCESVDALVWRVVDGRLKVVAQFGAWSPLVSHVGNRRNVIRTLPLTRRTVTGRAIVDRKTIHVHDLAAMVETEYSEAKEIQQRVGHRTTVATPLVSQGEALGAITVLRNHVRPFSNRQIALLKTFDDKAVIAIETARIFEELNRRTSELANTVEDLEIASQHKNQFVANMSHELRTPLAAILGYAELIQEGFYEPQGPKSLDALTRIRSNGKHLLGLINTVLDIAKIESGQFTLNMAEYAIESMIETVRAATESLAQNKKLTLTTSVDKPLPVGLGDEQRLTQVLLNLVGNAIKFTDAGQVTIAAAAQNRHFALSVTDTGPGIPLDQLDRIFDQFHQVDSSPTKAKGGTGLGLAIAREIVEMHGGRIWVESTLGKGSIFQMELPIRAELQKRAL